MKTAGIILAVVAVYSAGYATGYLTGRYLTPVDVRVTQECYDDIWRIISEGRRRGMLDCMSSSYLTDMLRDCDAEVDRLVENRDQCASRKHQQRQDLAEQLLEWREK